MSYPHQNSNHGNFFSDLDAQAQAAKNRNIQPADPVAFIKWVIQEIREKNEVYEGLKKRYDALSHSEDLATIGLKRLEGLILVDQRPQLDTLEEFHRDFTRANGGIGYTLEQTQNTIRDIVVNYQMVAESLRSHLADRFKKIGVQKELGLRLRDLDESLKRSLEAVGMQEKLNRQLSEGIQDLLSKTAVKLPPAVKENIAREDEVKRIALNLAKKINSGIDPVNYTRQEPVKPVEIAVPLSEQLKDNKKNKGLSETENSVSFVSAAAALVIGAILGILFLYKPKL